MLGGLKPNSRNTGSPPRCARASRRASRHMFSAGPWRPSHHRNTASCLSAWKVRVGSAQAEPVLDQELESPDQERDARHHRVAVARPEGNHEEQHAELGDRAQRALVLTAVEEE